MAGAKAERRSDASKAANGGATLPQSRRKKLPNYTTVKNSTVTHRSAIPLSSQIGWSCPLALTVQHRAEGGGQWKPAGDQRTPTSYGALVRSELKQIASRRRDTGLLHK